jgi:hypothetical protein
MSIDKDIMLHIENRLNTLSWVKLVNWKKLRLTQSDFLEHEVPLIQFYDAGQMIQHEAARLKVEWNISIELVLKSTSTEEIDVEDLLDRRQEVEQCLGAQSTHLGIQGLQHLRYTGNEPDYLSISPFFITRMDFVALYYKSYVRDC